MRVLILHSTYRSGPASGENRVVEDEARLLAEGGHDVDVFAPGVGDVSGLQFLGAGMRAMWSRGAAAEVRRRIQRLKPDVVHCHNLFPALSPAVLRTTRGEVPVVLTLHNYRLLCLPATFLRDGGVCEDCLGRVPWPGVLHRCYQESVPASAVLASSLMLHRTIHTFDHVRLYVAISNFVRNKHVEAGLPSDRIVVKSHFSWEVDRRKGPGDYFLFLGRLSPEKGVATLVAAWGDVPAKLLIVGDGPEGPRLRHGAPSNVEFKETVPTDQVPGLLRGARAVFAPSISHEGAGRVVLEAYAAGVPVVVSQAGGLPEVVTDGATGLVVRPGDADAWRAAAMRLLDDSLSERMGQAGWDRWTKEYAPEMALGALEDCYRRAMT